MNIGRSTKKVFVWIISIVLVLVIGLIAFWHFFKKDVDSNDPKTKPVIAKAVKKVVAEATDSLYKIGYSDLKLDIDSGYAVISNLKILRDTNISKKLLQENKMPNNIMSFTADKIVISGFGFNKVQGEQALHIGKMSVVNPSIQIINKRRGYNDTAKQTSWLVQLTKSLFKTIDTDNIVEMKIDNIFMNNTSLVYINDNEQKTKTTRLRNLDITINNVSTGSLANKEGTAKNDAAIKIGHQRIVTADKLYYVDFDNMRIIPAEEKIYVGAFSLTPTLTKAEFVKAVRAKKANYRYHFKYTGISMNDFDFERFSKKDQFYIPNVTVDNAWLEFYTNYNWPLRTPPNRKNKYPSELLQMLAFDVTIPKMVVKHADMYFKIIGQKSEKKAELTLNDLHSVTTNITNNTAVKNANPYTTVVSTCKVMNAGVLESQLVFNLKDKNAPYTLSSTLGAMDGTVLNPLSEALSLMQIQSANIEKMKINMKADEYRAVGNVDFYYKNMKVHLLKRDDKNDKLKKMSVVSFFTNMFLPNDNPKKNGNFRKGPINVVRDPRESFFGFMWRGMLDGTASAMSGADQKKDKPGNKVIELGKLFAGPKQGVETKSAGGDKERLEKVKNKSSIKKKGEE